MHGRPSGFAARKIVSGRSTFCEEWRPGMLPSFLVPLVFALAIFLALKCWFGVSARGARNK